MNEHTIELPATLVLTYETEGTLEDKDLRICDPDIEIQIGKAFTENVELSELPQATARYITATIQVRHLESLRRAREDREEAGK